MHGGGVSPADQIGNRARRLEMLLGGRAPSLVRWLPVIGVGLGLALGGLIWLVVGSEIILLRERVLALGALAGLVTGLLERTRLGRLLLAEPPPDLPPDLPAEFDHLARPFDHRDDALLAACGSRDSGGGARLVRPHLRRGAVGAHEQRVVAADADGASAYGVEAADGDRRAAGRVRLPRS
jgi:hypothetical protein